MIAARDGGFGADVYDLTMHDLLKRFIGAKQSGAPGVKRWSPGTVQLKKGLAKNHLLPVLQDRPLAGLTAHDCNLAISDARYDEDGDERMAVPMQCYHLLRQALEWARDERMAVSISFFANVRPPHYTPERRREFTTDEVARIVKAAQGRPDAALWLLMLERGLRTGEVRGILRPNVDRTQRLVKIAHQVRNETGGGARLIKRLKTANSYRDVPLSTYHMDLVDRQLEHLATLKDKAGDAWRDHGLLFPGDSGQPMDASILHRRWRGLLTAAGVDDYGPPHACRHTAISRMLRHIPITEVAAIVGDTPTTLLKTYAHARIDTARPALERLDARAKS